METLVLDTHFAGFSSVTFQLEPLALSDGIEKRKKKKRKKEEISSGTLKKKSSSDSGTRRE